MKELKSVWQYLKGKKTYIIGFIAIAYGIYKGETNIVLEGLGALTLRSALTTEITKSLLKK